MAQTVSNDALWEKLLEISQQLNSLSIEHKSQALNSKHAENAPDFSGTKDEIITKIKEEIRFLGNHSDVNFGAVNQNIVMLDEKVGKVWNIVARIRRHQRETAELQAESNSEQQLESLDAKLKDNQEYFNFRFFKLRKTSVVITALGLLVLILTVFCMKQQNDYTLLLNGYYRQDISIQKVCGESEVGKEE